MNLPLTHLNYVKVISNFHLSSKGHFPVKCLTGEICKTYSEYLSSEHWQNIRSEFYSSKIHPNHCNHCKANNRKLHLHHQTYERIGKEWLTDFIPLCEFCHNFLHEFLKKYHRIPEPSERGNFDLLKSKSIEKKFHKKKPIKPLFTKEESVMKYVKELFGEISRADVVKLFKLNDLSYDLLCCVSAIQYPSDTIKFVAEQWKTRKTIERYLPRIEKNPEKYFSTKIKKGSQRKSKSSKRDYPNGVAPEILTWFPDNLNGSDLNVSNIHAK